MGTATATGPTAVASPPTAEVRESEDPPAVRGEDSQLKVSPDGEIAIAPRGLRLITFEWLESVQLVISSSPFATLPHEGNPQVSMTYG